MGAIAMAMSYVTGERVCVTHTQHGMDDLEGMFDNRMAAERKEVLYKAAGLNALITNIKQGNQKKDDVEGAATPTTVKAVDFLAGVEAGGAADDSREPDRLIYKIIVDAVKGCYDWTFVDLAAGDNPQSRKFMEAADIIIVTLSQNRATWEMFFRCYGDIAKTGKAFYVLGGHKAESSYNVKNFSRMYI